MNEPMTMPPKPAQRTRRRWWLYVLAGLAVLIIIPAGWFVWSSLATKNAWRAAEDEAAADLTRWRLMEMDADRPKLAPEENSALHIIAAIKKGGSNHVSSAQHYDMIFEKLPQNVQMNHQQAKLIRVQFTKLGGAHLLARQLKDKPFGRFPIKYTDDVIGTLLPNHQDARIMADWLKHDAYLLAHERKPDEAIDSCLAMINAGRSMEGELFLISLLIRVAIQNIGLDALERVLAQDPPASAAALKRLQDAVEKEIASDKWLTAIRGERAGNHQLFVNLRGGKVKMPMLRGLLGTGGPAPTFQDRVVEAVPSLILQYYPDHLRFMNECVEISKLPIHERHEKLATWEGKIRKTDNLITRLLAPALSKVHQAECRSQILLRASAVALACERYRLKHGDWPKTLDVLVADKLLRAVPTDPMDGQPLRYCRTKDGRAIYSIGFDQTDEGGKINRERPLEKGVDYGFRLWDVSQRSRPPLPAVVPPEVDGPR